MKRELIPLETLLDAARLHFRHVAGSPGYTREARHRALELERAVTTELTAFNEGAPFRFFERFNLPHIHRTTAPSWREEETV